MNQVLKALLWRSTDLLGGVLLGGGLGDSRLGEGTRREAGGLRVLSIPLDGPRSLPGGPLHLGGTPPPLPTCPWPLGTPTGAASAKNVTTKNKSNTQEYTCSTIFHKS